MRFWNRLLLIKKNATGRVLTRLAAFLPILLLVLLLTSGKKPPLLPEYSTVSEIAAALCVAIEAGEEHITYLSTNPYLDSPEAQREIIARVKLFLPRYVKTSLTEEKFSSVRHLTIIFHDDGYEAALTEAERAAALVVREGMSEKEKAAALFDYLSGFCVYSYDAAADVSFGPAHTAYGALMEGRAVCSGFSDAYMMLCRAAGVNCAYITGEITVGGERISHAWNAFEADGTVFYADLTYGLFAPTPGELALDHSWDMRLIDELIVNDK